MKELYKIFSKNSFNVNIINGFINETLNVNQSIALKPTDEDWKYVHIFLRIIKKYQSSSGWLKQPKDMDWSTNSVGSFFMKNLRNLTQRIIAFFDARILALTLC